jgi:hypothetical protein
MANAKDDTPKPKAPKSGGTPGGPAFNEGQHLPLQSLKVRAIQDGYIGDGPTGAIYRHAGDVFTLLPRAIAVLDKKTGEVAIGDDGEPLTRTVTVADQFSNVWMEVVAGDVPEKITTAQQGLNRKVADVNAGPRDNGGDE